MASVPSWLNQTSIISSYLFLRKQKLSINMLEEIFSEKRMWDKEAKRTTDDPRKKLYEVKQNDHLSVSLFASIHIIFVRTLSHWLILSSLSRKFMTSTKTVGNRKRIGET